MRRIDLLTAEVIDDSEELLMDYFSIIEELIQALDRDPAELHEVILGIVHAESPV